MAVYEYHGTLGDGEELFEGGSIVAKNEDDAKRRLASRHYEDLSLERLTGVKAIVGRLKSG